VREAAAAATCLDQSAPPLPSAKYLAAPRSAGGPSPAACCQPSNDETLLIPAVCLSTPLATVFIPLPPIPLPVRRPSPSAIVSPTSPIDVAILDCGGKRSATPLSCVQFACITAIVAARLKSPSPQRTLSLLCSLRLLVAITSLTVRLTPPALPYSVPP